MTQSSFLYDRVMVTQIRTSNAVLMNAIRQRDSDMVARILESDPGQIDSIDQSGRAPIHVTCLDGNAQLAGLLVSYNADVNVRCIKETGGLCPLHIAARANNTTLCEILLQAGADVNGRSVQGCTPLMEAARTGSMEALRLLLDSEADDTLICESGFSAHAYATKFGFAAVAAQVTKVKRDQWAFLKSQPGFEAQAERITGQKVKKKGKGKKGKGKKKKKK